MPSKRSSPAVKYSELLDAFDLISAAPQYTNNAYICKDSGKVYVALADSDEDEDELPEDVNSSEHYLELPHKNDFDLGNALALAFAEQELPDHYSTLAHDFHSKGAYARFKEFLQSKNLLEAWHQYQAKATEKALRHWCEEHHIALIN
jgi:hypothetical protein